MNTVMDYKRYFNKYLSEYEVLSDECEKVDVWIKLLVEEGYVFNEFSKEILSIFGGLRIKGTGKGSKSYVEIYFNPVYYASGEFDRMSIYNKVTDDILFPVGGLYDYTIFVGEEGHYYMADWKNLYECGRSMDSFWKNVFSDAPQVLELYNNDFS